MFDFDISLRILDMWITVKYFDCNHVRHVD